MLKQSPATEVHAKSNEQVHRKSFFVPNIVPRDISGANDSTKTGKETISFSRTKPGMLLRPVHVRRASTGICDAEKFSSDMGSVTLDNATSKFDSVVDLNRIGSKNEVKDSCEDKYPIKSATDKFVKTLSPCKLSEQDSRKFLELHKSGQQLLYMSSLSYNILFTSLFLLISHSLLLHNCLKLFFSLIW